MMALHGRGLGDLCISRDPMNQVSLDTGKYLGSYAADSGLCNGRGEVSLLYVCMYVLRGVTMCSFMCTHVWLHM